MNDKTIAFNSDHISKAKFVSGQIFNSEFSMNCPPQSDLVVSTGYPSVRNFQKLERQGLLR
jgi:hypothetical protein